MQISSDTIKISFNKELYDRVSIVETLKSFKEVCQGTVKDGEKIEVHIKALPGEDPLKIRNEFCNHAFVLTANKRG